jgi:thiol:disulfide interchange protein
VFVDIGRNFCIHFASHVMFRTYFAEVAFSGMTRSICGLLFKIAIGMTFFFVMGSSPTAPAQSGFHANKNLYSETADPANEIDRAERVARRDHKRILLDFGGNWCGDCQVLGFYYHQAPNAELLAKYYVWSM